MPKCTIIICCVGAIEEYHKTFKTQVPSLKFQVQSLKFRELSLMSQISGSRLLAPKQSLKFILGFGSWVLEFGILKKNQAD
jgi:hypothetical protein